MWPQIIAFFTFVHDWPCRVYAEGVDWKHQRKTWAALTSLLLKAILCLGGVRCNIKVIYTENDVSDYNKSAPENDLLYFTFTILNYFLHCFFFLFRINNAVSKHYIYCPWKLNMFPWSMPNDKSHFSTGSRNTTVGSAAINMNKHSCERLTSI